MINTQKFEIRSFLSWKWQNHVSYISMVSENESKGLNYDYIVRYDYLDDFTVGYRELLC